MRRTETLRVSDAIRTEATDNLVNVRSQRFAILEYARQHDFRIDDGHRGDRLRPASELAKAGVAFVALKEPTVTR